MAKAHRICAILECNNPVKGWGFCERHYKNAKNHGDPLFQERRRAKAGEALAWLLEHAGHEDEESCLTWPFARMRGGYGHLQVNGRFHPAHRHMCRLAHGEPPTPTSQAAHSCGNGKNGCVNPKHLRWMSPSENAIENLVLGSMPTGEKCAHTFLTEREVIAIRRLHIAGVVQRRIAEAFEVTPQRVNEIIKHKAWKHVDAA